MKPESARYRERALQLQPDAQIHLFRLKSGARRFAVRWRGQKGIHQFVGDSQKQAWKKACAHLEALLWEKAIGGL